MNWGGQNPMPFITSTSSTSPRVAEFLRKEYPEHFVSRFDSAIDFDEIGAFQTLVDLMMFIAEKHDLKVSHAGDWSHKMVDGKIVYTGKKGRTLYIGSRTSVVYFRLYEKGKEQIDKMIDQDASPDWCRLELEVKPQKKKNRLAASKLKPCDAFSCSRAAVEVAELLGAPNMPRVRLGTVRDDSSDLDRRIAYLLYQYGNTIEDIVKERLGGCRADLGDYLESQKEFSKALVMNSKNV